ncbi:MAG TPA: VWA-like domain-containing protein [Gemmataceae bacterium]|jgi:predicted metal-dependent peptidase|nr:VWA-like domain-containing protein [Gemmataceae bacterium]
MTKTRPPAKEATEAKVREGFRRVALTFPYLAGLVDKIDVHVDARVPTMGIFASGRLAVNPAFVDSLTPPDLLFVLTHELYHLTLRTHDRQVGTDPAEFNIAHDYIINDLLCEELQVAHPPAEGLHMPGARLLSAEQILQQVRQAEKSQPSFGGKTGARRRQAGLGSGDVLDAATERTLFPDAAGAQKQRTQAIAEESEEALSLQALAESMRGRGEGSANAEDSMSALRTLYAPPWELALQQWMESVAPSDRSYARPSRRGADRRDVVLPGRKRESWMLNVVLDTSGSMVDAIPAALGAIGSFCDAMGVDEVRLLQCDADVTADERLHPAELASYRIRGFGGSDLSPALRRLADDGDVQAAIVITDGDVEYPREPMPYQVLWVLAASGSSGFAPPYGKVVPMN